MSGKSLNNSIIEHIKKPVKQIHKRIEKPVKEIKKHIKRPYEEIHKLTLKQKFSLFLSILVIIAFFITFIFSPVHYKTSILVSQGNSVSVVAGKLKDSNLILSEDIFKIIVLTMGGKLKAGYYDIEPGSSMFKIAIDMVKGRISVATVVVPEGMTALQIRHILYKNPYLTGDITIDMVDGELFPSTYKVSKGESRDNVIKLMKNEMQEIKKKYWDNIEHNGYLKDWNDIVVLASIIEKETMLDSEKSTVASVYMNRLKQQMKLQADPTVIYAITNKTGNMRGQKLLKSHLTTNNRYNTYKYYGLPPAPISNPGLQSILAAIKPAETDFLYFVADGRGGHIFSKTFKEHQENHNVWRKIRAQTTWNTEIN